MMKKKENVDFEISFNRCPYCREENEWIKSEYQQICSNCGENVSLESLTI